VGHKLGATQVGGVNAELMAQLRRPDEGAAPAPAPAGGNGPHSDVELRAAGLPASGTSPWIWIAAVLAIGLLVVGVYALVGGKLPP
jgi:hypothetical protein